MLDWNDRSSWVLLDRSSWVSFNRSLWVWVLPDRSLGDTLTDRCLWIEAREIGIEMIQKIDSEREIGIEMIGARELGS